LIQIKAEVSEVEDLKQYQPLYKFNFSEKHKIIELKICEDCFQDLKQHFINENRLIQENKDINQPLNTGLDISHVHFQDEESEIQESKENNTKGKQRQNSNSKNI
jgi:uncharacterized iron-regulated protein